MSEAEIAEIGERLDRTNELLQRMLAEVAKTPSTHAIFVDAGLRLRGRRPARRRHRGPPRLRPRRRRAHRGVHRQGPHDLRGQPAAARLLVRRRPAPDPHRRAAVASPNSPTSRSGSATSTPTTSRRASTPSSAPTWSRSPGTAPSATRRSSAATRTWCRRSRRRRATAPASTCGASRPPRAATRPSRCCGRSTASAPSTSTSASRTSPGAPPPTYEDGGDAGPLARGRPLRRRADRRAVARRPRPRGPGRAAARPPVPARLRRPGAAGRGRGAAAALAARPRRPAARAARRLLGAPAGAVLSYAPLRQTRTTAALPAAVRPPRPAPCSGSARRPRSTAAVRVEALRPSSSSRRHRPGVVALAGQHMLGQRYGGQFGDPVRLRDTAAGRWRSAARDGCRSQRRRRPSRRPWPRPWPASGPPAVHRAHRLPYLGHAQRRERVAEQLHLRCCGLGDLGGAGGHERQRTERRGVEQHGSARRSGRRASAPADARRRRTGASAAACASTSSANSPCA